MAIKSIKSSAWTDIGSLKVPVNGAYQTANHANALVSGAWQKVWSAEHYFLKNGVLMNGAQEDWMYGITVDGNSLLYKPSSDGSSATMIKFKLTSDMVGKTIYVRVNSNIKTRTESPSRYLRITYPLGGGVGSAFDCINRASADLLYFSPIRADDVTAPDYYTTIGVQDAWGGYEYRIYDVYVA